MVNLNKKREREEFLDGVIDKTRQDIYDKMNKEDPPFFLIFFSKNN